MTILEKHVPPAPATEPGRTLEDAQPRTLGIVDMVALWGNLGVSLLGPAYAYYVLVPGAKQLSLAAAFTAVVVGSVIGGALLAAALGASAISGSRDAKNSCS